MILLIWAAGNSRKVSFRMWSLRFRAFLGALRAHEIGTATDIIFSNWWVHHLLGIHIKGLAFAVKRVRFVLVVAWNVVIVAYGQWALFFSCRISRFFIYKRTFLVWVKSISCSLMICGKWDEFLIIIGLGRIIATNKLKVTVVERSVLVVDLKLV